MSLGQALATAISGLRANQVGISLVSSNVANAETPGYVRKSVSQIAVAGNGAGASVRIAGINRELDLYVQRQLRTETSGASYADVRADFLGRLQSIYGDPGSDGTIETAFNNLTNAVQALSTSPDSQSARIAVVNAAQSLAQQLNATTQGIQTLRGDAETGLNNAVNIANNAMRQIANINVQLQGNVGADSSSAALQDQRDQYLAQLAQLVDIRVVTNDANQVTVFTNSGVQLVGTEAAHLSFNPQGTVTANTLWNPNPLKSNLGSLTVNFPHGGSLDLVATNAIRSGTIAAFLELRDDTLVKAQTQIDQFAASLASALSDVTIGGLAATAGAQTGFDVDLANVKPGNVIHLSYTNVTTGAVHKVSIVRVDDPAALPLQNAATVDPNDEVIGINFSGGLASVVSQLNAALGGSNIQFSNPAGTTLRVLDDGAANLANVNALSTTTTASSLTAGAPQLALFTDGGTLYTGAIGANGLQFVGLGGRIKVNQSVIGDPSRLIIYNTSPLTASGDTTRSDFILAQLTAGSYFYSPQTGIGTTTSPFKGTLLSFTQQFTSAQGEAASAARQLSDGQNVVLNTLQKKFDTTSGVNIDEEMAHLLSLQNAYSANARVLSTVKEMYAALLQAI